MAGEIKWVGGESGYSGNGAGSTQPSEPARSGNDQVKFASEGGSGDNQYQTFDKTSPSYDNIGGSTEGLSSSQWSSPTDR